MASISQIVRAFTRLKPQSVQKGLHTLPFRPLSTFTNDQGKVNRVKSIKEIPGPLSLPIFGTLWRLPIDIMKSKKPMQKAILDGQFEAVKTYGRIVKMALPDVQIIMLADPQAVAKIFQNETKYPRRFDIPVFDYYRERRKTTPGVFFANGPEWHKYRSVISKRMLRPKEVADYEPTFNQIITDFLERLSNIRGPKASEFENEIKELDNELFKWSFESVAHVLFDKRFGCLEEEVNPEAQDFIRSVGRFLAANAPVIFLPVQLHKLYETKPFREFVQSFDNIYHWVELFVERKFQEMQREEELGSRAPEDEKRVDFFKFLLSSGTISKDEILASVVDLLFAGVDTTSNTMQWVLYMMGKNHDKQETLHQEVSSVLKPGEIPTVESLTKMPYLKAWVRETLRLYPVLSNHSRVIQEDINVLGYKLPAGTQISILAYFLGRDEETFKDAAKFIPERWLRDSNHKMSEDINAFASIPFGFGTRMCVGRRIAEMEMHLLLARIVQQFSIQYPHEDEVEPFFRVVTIPDRPVRVKFVDRH